MSMTAVPDHGGEKLAARRQAEEHFAIGDTAILRRVWAFVRPYRWRLLAALSIPYAIRSAFDSIVNKPGAFPLNEVLAIFLALIGANAFTSYLSDVTAARLAQRVIFDMRRAMFEHLQRVSISFVDKSHVGRIMSRLQGDVNAPQEFFETSITAIGDLALLVGIVAVLLAMEWRLACVTLLLLPILVLVRALWLPAAHRAFTLARDHSSIVNGALAENIAGVRIVQGSRREALNLKDFAGKVDTSFRAQLTASWLGQIMTPTVDILTGAAMGTIVVGGGWLVLNGAIDLGVMVAFIFYVQRFFDPIRTLSQQYTMMQRAVTAAHRIFEVLDVPVEVQNRPGALSPEGITPSVELRAVTFGYRPGHPVLKDLSLRIEPRQVVALVGATGSGKSSIASLTRRLYDVWDGQVLVGGHDVRDVTLDSLGRNIAMVLQEPFLFTGTVLENIRYSSHWASREAVVQAAKAVCAHELILKLPDGYDTQIGQRGQNFSAGQRQLISLARALVADPAILILDEATASIDSFVEAQVQEGLKAVMQGRTTLLIAHRLATVRNADKIIVLNHGEILEQGSPKELLEKGGLYAEMHRRNFSSFDEL
jgi:ATP-binding cassette, subfamily B, multidrug efflux pump